MAETQPMNLQALCYTAAEDRQHVNSWIGTEGVSNEAGGALLVTTTGAADHSVSVAAGQAFIVGDDHTPGQGMYRVRNDDAEVVQLPVGSGGGLNRIDTIVATVRDSEYSGLDNDWVIDIVAGTAGAGAGASGADFTAAVLATAGAVPDNSIVLGYVRVLAADTLTSIIASNNVFDGRTPYQPANVPRWHQIGGVGEPAFSGSWVNSAGGSETAAYRKIGDIVYLRGSIKNGTLGATAFTLPVGFRPPIGLLFATESNGAYGRVIVNPTGAVDPSVGSNTAFSLNNVSFSVTA